jgi:hypothetical protein
VSVAIVQPESFSNDILAAFASLISQIPGIPPIRRRKRPIRLNNEKELQALVFISLISDAKDWEAFIGPSGQRSVNMIYTVQVTVSFQGNYQYQIDQPSPLYWREQIRQQFLQPLLPGVPSVWDMSYTLGPVYDPAAMGEGYDSESITFTVQNIEPANGPMVSNQGVI